MTKELENYFEKARQSFKADLPLDQIEDMIAKQPATSVWATKKWWIMGSSILSITSIILISLFWTNNTTINSNSTTTLENNIPVENSSEQPIELASFVDHNPIKIPIDAAPEEVDQVVDKVLAAAQKATTDTLKPKTSFTEYKVEIRKENSQKDVEQLQQELNDYGISMQVDALEYNDKNEISRFKGQFDTDSLYCGKLSSYDFDVKGPFKQIEFTFRVSNEKNLKYLRIESDNFEKTIECYDDEVLSDAHEARVEAEIMHRKAKKAAREAKEQLEEARVAQRKALKEIRQDVWGDLHEDIKNEVIILMEEAHKIGREAIEIDVDAIKEQIEEAFDVYKDAENEFKDVDIIIRKEFKNVQKDIKKALKEAKHAHEEAMETWKNNQNTDNNNKVSYMLCNNSSKEDLDKLKTQLANKGVNMTIEKIVYKRNKIQDLTFELKASEKESWVLKTQKDPFGHIQISFRYSEEDGASHLWVEPMEKKCK
ncbi:MAG: hypothetical protein GY810_05345 [Aureispira sp.]|nr:hypothetical protein [Aureispira sp.]